MTTLQKIRQNDVEAVSAILEVLDASNVRYPDELITAVLENHPQLSFDSVRRATLTLIDRHTVTLTADQRIRLA